MDYRTIYFRRNASRTKQLASALCVDLVNDIMILFFFCLFIVLAHGIFEKLVSFVYAAAVGVVTIRPIRAAYMLIYRVNTFIVRFLCCAHNMRS